MDEKVLTAIILAVFVVVLFTVLGRAWLRRTRASEAQGGLPELPEQIESWAPMCAVEGMYVATCRSNNHLERIMGHSLGLRTSARAFVYPQGVLYDRDGTQPLWIPAEHVSGFGTTSGMVGKFVERDGIAVVSWQFRGQPVDTGFRTKSGPGKAELLTALQGLIDAQPGIPSASTTSTGISTDTGQSSTHKETP